MSDELKISPGSLALYKHRPARVVKVGAKLEIELDDGNRARVREKDITPLHPGPLESLQALTPQKGELMLAWEILSETPEETHTIAEISDLIYGAYTPASAWAAWQLVEDGLYFRGQPEAVQTCTPEEVAAERDSRQARAAEAQAWLDFLSRAQDGAIDLDLDGRFLREVEDLALGRRKDSRVLRELGRSERPENAHTLLLKCGYWGPALVPYAQRLGLPIHSPEIELPALSAEERLDLTHLEAYAIDDRDNQDPDDAISLDTCQFDPQGNFLGGRIWVHIADGAALVPPDSPADLEARSRSATLYLPDGAALMLPQAAVTMLGLGLTDISPALSFGLQIDADGALVDIQIQPSRVRVQRLSYERAAERLEEPPLRELHTIARVFQARRQANGALFIDLPEAIIRVDDGQVAIRPLQRFPSRDLVREAMLMAGEAAAQFALQNQIPFPFATQEAPDWDFARKMAADNGLDPTTIENPDSIAAFYILRRALKRSQVSGYPAPHSGVGLPVYSRATSPLRRYLDLVAHQQLRAFLRGGRLMDQEEMLHRIGASESVTGSVSQAESLARRHWTLVYLQQNPDWEGEAVLIEKNERRGRVIIPDLALEIPVHLKADLPLNSHLMLKSEGVNLPELEAHFVIT